MINAHVQPIYGSFDSFWNRGIVSTSPQSFTGRIAAAVIASPKRAWSLIGLLTLVSVMLATRLTVDPNMLKLLPAEHESTQAIMSLQESEGGVELLTIAVDGADKAEVDAFLHELVDRFEAMESVQYALYDIDPDLAWRIGLMQLPQQDLARIRDRLQGALNFGPAMLNPFIAAQWMDLGPMTSKLKGEGQTASIGSTDGTARVVIRPVESAQKVDFSQQLMADTHAIIEEMRPESRGVKIEWIGGAYRHTVEDVESIGNDLRWTAIVSLVLVFTLIGTAFRDVRAIVMIFGPLFFGNVWTLGYAALSVGTLNTFTSFFMAVLIGLGVDFSIHLYSRYREIRESGVGVEDAIVGAWDRTGPPCVAAAFTSAAGFCALWIADFIAFQQLGTLLAGGVLLCLTAVLVVLPLFILWRDKKGVVARRQMSKEPDTFLGIRSKGHPTYRLAPTCLLLVGIISIAAATTLRKVEFEYDLSQLRTTGLSYDDLSEKERQLAEDSYPPVVVAYPDADALAADHERLNAAIDAGTLPELQRAISIYSVLPVDQEDRLSTVREIAALARHENLQYLPPPVRENLKRMGGAEVEPLTIDELPYSLRHVLGSVHDQHWALLFPTGNMWDLRETVGLYEAVQKWVPDYPAAGQYLALSALYQVVRDDAPRIIGLALLFVGLLTWMHMKSWKRAVSATAALVAGLCWAGAGLALFRVKLSMINFVGIPILMGIGIDVVIHLLHRLHEEGPGKILRALATTGMAAALSSATTILSFASLSAAGNRGIRSMGLMIVLGLALVTLAGFTAIPLGWMTTWKLRRQLPKPEEE